MSDTNCNLYGDEYANQFSYGNSYPNSDGHAHSDKHRYSDHNDDLYTYADGDGDFNANRGWRYRGFEENPDLPLPIKRLLEMQNDLHLP